MQHGFNGAKILGGRYTSSICIGEEQDFEIHMMGLLKYFPEYFNNFFTKKKALEKTNYMVYNVFFS